MHENQSIESKNPSQDTVRIAKNYAYERPAIQTALFILWRVHNKQYQTGARIFYDELEKATKTSKTAYKEALAFLEGAGMVVNEVVVESKVPQSLIQRYGILKDE